MTINEAMTMLKVSRTTLSKWLSTGKLTGRNRGNGTWDLDQADVEALRDYRISNPPKRGRKK